MIRYYKGVKTCASGFVCASLLSHTLTLLAIRNKTQDGGNRLLETPCQSKYVEEKVFFKRRRSKRSDGYDGKNPSCQTK